MFFLCCYYCCSLHTHTRSQITTRISNKEREKNKLNELNFVACVIEFHKNFNWKLLFFDLLNIDLSTWQIAKLEIVSCFVIVEKGVYLKLLDRCNSSLHRFRCLYNWISWEILVTMRCVQIMVAWNSKQNWSSIQQPNEENDVRGKRF